MKIAKLMTRNVKTCHHKDTLDCAARLMWDFDLGAVPIVDDSGQVVGIVTDRDCCMAVLHEARPLHALPVTVAMTNHVVTCRPEDSAAEIATLMAKNRVRRIPVVDEAQRPIGMVSITDLAMATPQDVGKTLVAICEPRAHSVAPTHA